MEQMPGKKIIAAGKLGPVFTDTWGTYRPIDLVYENSHGRAIGVLDTYPRIDGSGAIFPTEAFK